MSSLNHVVLIGRLARDPELRQTPLGTGRWQTSRLQLTVVPNPTASKRLILSGLPPGESRAKLL